MPIDEQGECAPISGEHSGGEFAVGFRTVHLLPRCGGRQRLRRDYTVLCPVSVRELELA
jgi:hypothetical protein